MKKSVLLLAALMPFVMFSCEKEKAEKGSDDIVGSDGKYLVKKMTFQGTLGGNYAYTDNRGKLTQKVDATLNFSYIKGKMSRLDASGTYSYVDDWEEFYEGNTTKYYDEENYKGNGNIKFAYKDDRVEAKITAQGRVWGTYIDEGGNENNRTWEEQGSLSGTYTFSMDDGIAISGCGTFKEDANSESYNTDEIKFGYDDNEQLTSVHYADDDGRMEFKWKDGNIENIGWFYDDDYYYKKGSKSIIRSLLAKKKTPMTKFGSVGWENWVRVEYSPKENKSNIDFSRLIFAYISGEYVESNIGVFGFTGKESKNLPSTVYVDDEPALSFEYEFNRNGAVTRIKLIAGPYFDNVELEIATATINIEY